MMKTPVEFFKQLSNELRGLGGVQHSQEWFTDQLTTLPDSEWPFFCRAADTELAIVDLLGKVYHPPALEQDLIPLRVFGLLPKPGRVLTAEDLTWVVELVRQLFSDTKKSHRLLAFTICCRRVSDETIPYKILFQAAVRLADEDAQVRAADGFDFRDVEWPEHWCLQGC